MSTHGEGASAVENPYWSELITDALPGRVAKPRISGLTMVIDTGIPLTLMTDLLQLCAEHIDYWKFGFGSASVCASEYMMNKITLCQEYGVLAYPGGTSLEIAITQGNWREYLQALWTGGVKVVEVSDGTIDLSPKKRREVIRHARKIGFTVLTEVGKKLAGSFLPASQQAQLIHGDLNSGANYVIVEGREGGRSVGVYDAEGNVREDDVQQLLDILGPLSTRLIWEAPLTKQQVFYIRQLGNKVNLGNIKVSDVVTLESMRRGLRSDTLRTALGMPTEQASIADSQDQAVAQSSWSDSDGLLDDQSVTRPKLWTSGQKGTASQGRAERWRR